MPPPTRSTEPAKNPIPLRFTDRELEQIDQLRGPDESRSRFVRRLLAEAVARVEADGWLPPAYEPGLPGLGDLGPLEDDPVEAAGLTVSEEPPAGLGPRLCEELVRLGASPAEAERVAAKLAKTVEALLRAALALAR